MEGEGTKIHDLEVHPVSGNGKLPAGRGKVGLFPACAPEILAEIFATHRDQRSCETLFCKPFKVRAETIFKTKDLTAGGLTVFGSAAPLLAQDEHLLAFFD